MDTARIELKPASLVRILSVGGDLRLTGAESPRLEAQAGHRGGLHVATKADGVELTCDGGCLVFLPSGCRVEIGRVAGDGRVTDLLGALKIETVDGDLRLRHLGPVTVGRVKGDLMAQRLRDGLTVESAGGDALVEKLEGDVRLDLVGGDLRVAGLAGSLNAKVNGDAILGYSPREGSRSSLTAKGDVTVRVPLGSSLRADLQARGDLRVESSGLNAPGGNQTTVMLNEGRAELVVEAGGDLRFSETARADPSDLAGAITAQVEAALSEAEATVDAELGEGTFRSADVGGQVRRAVERALRSTPGRDRDSAGPVSEPEPNLESERKMILDMLADHRITADQAEALFHALEGPG